MTYIEDYLEYICNNQLDCLQSNNNIYFSIYRQTVRGVGITDRQYALVLKKIQEYMDVQDPPTRIPLRHIDRSKYVKVVDNSHMTECWDVLDNSKNNWQWIKIRFPFSKKDILKIEKINRYTHGKEYYHKKGSHEHYYKLTGANLRRITQAFDTFDFDEQVKKYKDEVDDVIARTDEIINDLPTPQTDFNDIQKYDRRFRLGLVNLSKPFTNNSLLDQVIDRNDHYFNVSESSNNINNIVEILVELDRFPLLVLINKDNSYQELSSFYNAIKYVVPSEKQSVLFRVTDPNSEENVNSFVRHNNLNNWVDKETKIVYISKDKLPKVLFTSEFRPITSFSKTNSKNQQLVDLYINHCCDLNLSLDNDFWNNSYQRYIKGRF